jgi:RHS repeat-associated protein
MLLTEEGYIEKSGSTYTHHYYLKDHIGNHRIVMNSAGTVVQATNYYPSGTTMADYPRATTPCVQPYKFGGKELDRKDNLNFYDYEASAYDPALMRFTSTNPMMEKYYGWSPFAYCLNNPVKYLDPTGLEVYYAQNGIYLGQVGENNDIRVLNSTLSQADAMSYIESASEESIASLMGNSVAFADYFTTVSDVTNGASVVPYNGNCYSAASQQIGNAGYTPEGSKAKSTIFTKVENGQNGAGQEKNPNNLSENTVGGAIKVMTDLQSGKPVLAGVYQTDGSGNYRHEGSNTNPLTSHFVVINSATAIDGVVSFNYLDNAGGKGPLTLNLTNGAVAGGITGRGAMKAYTVSEVRNSWKPRR